jgi:hypothetical protein
MNNQSTTATLIAQSGAKKITREQLREIELPEATRTHQPLSHYEIVNVLEEALSFRMFRVIRDEYAVSLDGMKMFGIMELNSEFAGCRFSIGIRNSNDKSMRLALTVGMRVLVCSNMAFSGDFTPMFQKHSKTLSLVDSISIAVDRIHRGFKPLEQQVGRMRQLKLSDSEVKLLIYKAFLDKQIRGIPRHLMPIVHDYYFNPKYEAFQPRTLWSLSNAFTSSFKELNPLKQFEITAKLGSFISDIESSLISRNGAFLELPKEVKALPPIGGYTPNNVIPIKPFVSESNDNFNPDDVDEDDIPDDSFDDEDFDRYFDQAEAEEEIDEATEKLIEKYEMQAA